MKRFAYCSAFQFARFQPPSRLILARLHDCQKTGRYPELQQLLSRLIFFAAGLLIAANASAQYVSEGDQVTTIAETPVKANADTLTTLPKATTFRVKQAQGDWVSFQESRNGRKINGWVAADDVLKLPPTLTATRVARTDVTSNSMHYYEFTSPDPVEIVYHATSNVDAFIVDKENFEKLKSAFDRKSRGDFTAKRGELNSSYNVLKWTGSPDELILVIDNSEYPSKGAPGLRPINVKIAFCQQDPKPVGMVKTRGLLLGKVSVQFKGYKGKNGPFNGRLRVEVNCIDGDETEILTGMADEDGYFFIENVKPNRSYGIKRISFGNANASFGAMSGKFRSEKERNIWVHDLGTCSAAVTEDGSVERQQIAEGMTITSELNEEGKISTHFKMTSSTLPLDRHDWFIKTFPDSDWVERVSEARDAIYAERAKKKKEKSAKEDDEEDDAPAPPVKDGKVALLKTS